MFSAMLVATLLSVTIPPDDGTHISDQAEMLTGAQMEAVSALFDEVRTEQGVKMGLITFKYLDDSPKSVSVRALNYWNMSPDSVMMLVSFNPRKVFIQPGSNLEYKFDEATSVELIRDNIVPSLRDGKYGAGILHGFRAIRAKISGGAGVSIPEERPVVSQEEHNTNPFMIFSLVAISLIAIGLTIKYVLRRRREKEEQAATARAYVRRNKNDDYPPHEPPYSPSGYLGPAQGPTVVTNVNAGSNNGLVTGMLLNETLHHNHDTYSPPVKQQVDVVKPTYTPPEPAPSHSSDSSSNNSSSGGGYDWSSSSSSSSSDSSGGGGSDWGSSSSGSDSGSSGGGGSAW